MNLSLPVDDRNSFDGDIYAWLKAQFVQSGLSLCETEQNLWLPSKELKTLRLAIINPEE